MLHNVLESMQVLTFTVKGDQHLPDSLLLLALWDLQTLHGLSRTKTHGLQKGAAADACTRISKSSQERMLLCPQHILGTALLLGLT